MTVIATIDLEEGDLTDWTTTANGTDLAVNGTAAMVGSYGMAVTQDGSATSTRGEIDFSISTSVVRWRFYFDPNSLSMGTGDAHAMCQLHGSPANVALVYLAESSGNFQVRMNCYDDASSHTDTTYTTISDAPHYIECQIERATNSTSNDGTGTVWIDGVETAGTVTNLDNYDLFATIDSIYLGAVTSLDATTTGTNWFDDLIINDDGSEIGAASSAALEQEGYRWRDDNGSESAASWLVSQDTSTSVAYDTNIRVRVIANATGDPASISPQIENREQGAGDNWSELE